VAKATLLAAMMTGTAGAAEAATPACQFQNAFKAVHDNNPDLIGDCTDNEHLNNKTQRMEQNLQGFARLEYDGKNVVYTPKNGSPILFGVDGKRIVAVNQETQPKSQSSCSINNGFADIAQANPDVVGKCLDNEQPDSKTNVVVQHTDKGEFTFDGSLVEFTDGYRTWIKSSTGIVSRLNSERYPWENDKPEGVKIISENPTPDIKVAPVGNVSFITTNYYSHEVDYGPFKQFLLDKISHGVNFISLDQFVRGLNGQEIISPNSAMITWDDSRESQFTNGRRAVLEVENETGKPVPVTVFALTQDERSMTPTELLDPKTVSFNDGVHKNLTIDEEVQMIKDGFSLQVHTDNHPNLAAMDPKVADGEIKTSDQKIDGLYKRAGVPRKVRAIAYPYGSTDAAVMAMVQADGFDAAFGTSNTDLMTSQNRFDEGRTGLVYTVGGLV